MAPLATLGDFGPIRDGVCSPGHRSQARSEHQNEFRNIEKHQNSSKLARFYALTSLLESAVLRSWVAHIHCIAKVVEDSKIINLEKESR